MNDVRDQTVNVGSKEVDRNRRPSALEGVLRDQQPLGRPGNPPLSGFLGHAEIMFERLRFPWVVMTVGINGADDRSLERSRRHRAGRLVIGGLVNRRSGMGIPAVRHVLREIGTSDPVVIASTRHGLQETAHDKVNRCAISRRLRGDVNALPLT